jgi:hypothetical protein
MNIGIAADDSLRQVFPDAPQFGTAEQAQKYYRRKAAAGRNPKIKVGIICRHYSVNGATYIGD